MSGIVIVALARTGVGKFGGTLAKTAAVDLGAHVVRGLLAQAGVPGDAVSEVMLVRCSPPVPARTRRGKPSSGPGCRRARRA